jgi:hypothetical protein
VIGGCFAVAAALFVLREQLFVGLFDHKDLTVEERSTLNSALQAFLQVAGFLYVLVFASVLSKALEKRDRLRGHLGDELSALTVITIETLRLPPSAAASQQRVLRALAGYTAALRGDLERRRENGWLFEFARLFAIVPEFEAGVAKARGHGPRASAAAALRDVRRLLMRLHHSRTARYSEQSQSTGAFFWLYLGMLAVVHFFAILLLESGSPALNITLCGITVFSIVLSLSLMNGIDSAFGGASYSIKTTLHAELSAIERAIAAHLAGGKNDLLF